MNQMYTENTKITIALLECFRNVFSPTVEAKGLKTPEHFDFIIDSFLVAKVISFFPGILDANLEDELVDYIYKSNINKLKNANLSRTTIVEKYTFGIIYDDILINKIIEDYEIISKNESVCKRLIKESIQSSLSEIIAVNASYRNFNPGVTKIKVPVNFFINCFVHPILLFPNRDYILYEHQIEIEKICEKIYIELSKKLSALAKEITETEF